ncbi:FAD-dependent oxidoreductase (plasmid) [Sphaerotilus natans]|uniref:FAD-dependent oxidoreductase n=1 Tax=Sphaerotilus natans TaxID=34103 RepID=UPI00406CC81F
MNRRIPLDLGRLTEAERVFDLIVVGAGGAGLTAALCAAIDGARVLLVERTAQVGGTTALSGGTTWVPLTHHAATVNPHDSRAAVERYLDLAVGEHAPRALRQAFLDHGAEAIAHLEACSEVRWRAYPRHPDYLSELEGSTVCGRALEPLPFDGRQLGALFALLRAPIPEFTVLGGMMVDRTDINHLLGMTRSLRSARHAARLLSRHAIDRMRHPRGTRLVMGNALVGRLLLSLSRQVGAHLAVGTELIELHRAGGGGHIEAVTVAQGGQRLRLGTRCGVILASGGFNRHPERRAALLPGIDLAWCPGAPGHTGRAHDAAEAVGAVPGAAGLSPAFWAPVSRRRRADGSEAVFPHFLMDRAKPGFISVNARGERFVNESTSYHLFGLAMQRPENQATPAWLVCDQRALQAYGIGMVRPGGQGLAPFQDDGYLISAPTLAELAGRLGVPPQALRATVARFNTLAERGEDLDFGRGVTAYQRNMGDAAWRGPNPNLGPLQQAPFHAVRLWPGDIGAALGLATDARARVLDAAGRAVPGLWAVGNDMHSLMGGVYTGPGITIGPGVVFAWLASRDALSARSAAPASPSSLPEPSNA